MGPVFPAKAEAHMTVAYDNLLMARLYGFPPARERREAGKTRGGKDERRERRENEKALAIASS